MQRALREYQIDGIKSNIGFFEEVLRDPEFRKGDFDTGFIDRFLEKTAAHRAPLQTAERDLAAIVAAIFQAKTSAPETASRMESESPWKIEARRRGLRSS
jgi:acetyl/propionyl-CoA carboxylase alpha subunit